ncbi:hypothetical protein BLOT_016737 [Blomia tropicalis]|nr:hypothetical protein BLOT_016737 [Blomia tropicalis]
MDINLIVNIHKPYLVLIALNEHTKENIKIVLDRTKIKFIFNSYQNYNYITIKLKLIIDSLEKIASVKFQKNQSGLGEHFVFALAAQIPQAKELIEQLKVKGNLNYQGVPSTPHQWPLQLGI